MAEIPRYLPSRLALLWIGILMFCGWLATAGHSQRNVPGDFEGSADIGRVQRPGSVRFDRKAGRYRISGGGANVWDRTDAFQYLWRRMSGDLSLTAEVDWKGTTGNAHRKAGWMVRQGLEPDAPYADAVVHADGLISLQYRRERGGITEEIASPVKAPAVVRLERHGDVFTLSVARTGTDFQPIGSLTVALKDPVYAGLAVCSHDEAAMATAAVSGVTAETRPSVPDSKRIVESTLETLALDTGERRILYRARSHFEAPNWSLDGSTLVCNSQGRLYRLPAAGGQPEPIDTGFATQCNNDHGFSPDGKQIVISHSPSRAGSQIYILPSAGGTPRQVTAKAPSYWHGWSPDGKTLVYCASRNGEFDVYAIPVEGGEETRLTTAPGLDDGPEYSPDGKFIFFNSDRTGLMKIWRMNPDGTEQVQVTADPDYADWFAHPSPDGKWLVFVSYGKEVKGHPPNKDVALRIMPVSGGKIRVLTRLFGGQGTINVPSWSPDSKRFAFVSYRLVAP